MEAKLNTEKASWSGVPYLHSDDVIAVQRGPEPGGAGGASRGRSARRCAGCGRRWAG